MPCHIDLGKEEVAAVTRDLDVLHAGGGSFPDGIGVHVSLRCEAVIRPAADKINGVAARSDAHRGAGGREIGKSLPRFAVGIEAGGALVVVIFSVASKIIGGAV